MNPRKKKQKQKNPPFLSLPNDIILACLARISRSYNPKLALVCKTFRSLIVSYDLAVARYHLKPQETVFELCLQCLNSSRRYLFTLWTKPGQPEKNKKRSTRNTRLVQIPSSCKSYKPFYTVSVGSEKYGLSQSKTPSSSMWIVDKKSYTWQKATIPNMSVAREKPLAVVPNGKIFVMGGCAADESVNYGEVFDPKTQTWEPLPDPGAELRFSSIRKLEVVKGKLYVRSNEKTDSVYDPKEGKWDVAKKSLVQCLIEGVRYCCDEQNCLWWYDTNHKKWRVVEGLATLFRKRGCGMIEIANYGGKLLILWDKFVHDHDPCSYKDIWCAVITLERSNGTDIVWGNIEWAEIVHTVPRSFVFLHSLLSKR